MQILDLSAFDLDRVTQTAAILYESFRHRASAWPNLASARAEVVTSLEPWKVSRVAVDDSGCVVGWVGGQPQYDGRVWELHPLVVAQHVRRQGIGRALVQDLEMLVVARGAMTLWLGSDDEIEETSFANVDLYDDFPTRLGDFRAGGEHPYPFYHRLGFRLVGVMPDANGRGKPDIFLAKRVGTS